MESDDARPNDDENTLRAKILRKRKATDGARERNEDGYGKNGKEERVEKGTVVRIEPYGAFMEIYSTRSRGLVHISEMHENRRPQMGQELFVRVLPNDGKRLRLSDQGVNMETRYLD